MTVSSLAHPGALVAAPTRTRSAFTQAAGEAGVIWAGLFALGIGFGMLATSQGLAWWVAPVMSALTFAGAAQFLVVGMVATGAPLVAIAVTVFLLNARHVFYGLTFPLHRVPGRLGKAYSVFTLCDEAFALLSTKDPGTLAGGRILWTQLGLHGSWVVGSFAGSLLGTSLPGTIPGIDFVMTALFLVLTLEAYRATPDRLTLGLAAGAGIVALLVAPGSMLLVAMAVFATSLAVRHHRARHA